MKKLIILFSCFLVFAGTVSAQKNDTLTRAKVKNRMSKLDSTKRENLKEKGITENSMKELDLSKDQFNQIEGFRKSAKEEKEKIKNDNTLTEAQKEEKIKAVDENFRKKSGSVMTKEQRSKVEKKRSELKGKKKDSQGAKPQ
ncbi:MAG TPA: hypothetical protein PLP23_19190 [Panacibacter sp.]|nr:hypothetical protein [Panacibacter sp.]